MTDFDSSAARKRSASEESAPSALSDRVQSLRLPSHYNQGHGASRLPWILCLLFAGAAAGMGVWVARNSARATEPTETTSNTTSTANTSVATTAARGPESDVALESKGYIVPAHQILVSPKVNGMIVRLGNDVHPGMEEGVRVTKGDILAEIESTDYQADFERAKALLALESHRLLELENGNRPEEIAQSEAELAEAVTNLQQLESEWNRNQGLRKRGVLTQQDFELSESQFNATQERVKRLRYSVELMRQGARKERIEAARATVEQAKADVAKARWRLDNCTIRAPISGTILKKNAEEGNIVNPIAFNGSFSICDLADLADLEVDLSIQERDVSRVFQGQKCTVRSDAYPDRVYEGYVSRLMPIADRAKGAVPVRVKLRVPSDEEGVYLKPEMAAVVTFYHRDREPPSK